MATQRSFNDMLNEYITNSLLKAEMIKRDYILKHVKHDEKWTGGKVPVPFKAAGASSIKLGGLTASNDIAESEYVRGYLDDYKEVWASLIFHYRDLQDHSGKITENTFLKVLPDTIEDAMQNLKDVISVQLGTGPDFAKVTDSTDAATGVMVVDRIDRFMLNQKMLIQDDDTAVFLPIYVIAIDLNTNKVTFSATRKGAAVDLSAYTAAENAMFYLDGGDDAANFFTSIKSALLSAANGGTANLHGKSKLAYPFLQAINIDGSSVTASNILEKIFKGYVDVRIKTNGMADTVLMSYKNMGSMMAIIEYGPTGSNGKSPFKVLPSTKSASMYGWDEINIMQVGSGKNLKIVAIQEWSDDLIAYIDWSAFTFRSNGLVKKHKNLNGDFYYPLRTTSGHSYISDIHVFGELEVCAPQRCAIMHGISY